MKMLIAVPVYNRLAVTELCLANLYRHRGDAVLHVYNDHSTEFSGEVLAPFCDEVIELPARDRPVFRMASNRRGMGVQHLRWHQLRDFLQRPEFDLLYFTDSDALHDPSYYEVIRSLMALLKKTGRLLPVCLYNSSFHAERANEVGGTDRLAIRKTAPGISQLYTREMVAAIVGRLDRLQEDPDYNWDYIAPGLLGLPILTTRDSYLEHFGAVSGSMHTAAGAWDRDRALYPTPYLAARRQEVIDYLEGAVVAAPSL